MKHLITISSMMLMSSYLFTAERTEYPRHGQLSRKPNFRKPSSIMLHNKTDHYDITAENSIVSPGRSKKVHLHLEKDPELAVFVYALDSELTLKFEDSLPTNVYFTEKNNCIEIEYDEKFIKRYDRK
jgi:hypothetical protein